MKQVEQTTSPRETLGPEDEPAVCRAGLNLTSSLEPGAQGLASGIRSASLYKGPADL